MTALNLSVYIVDSDVLIQAHRQYYAFDICPGFWDALIYHHTQGKLFCIDKIHDEITGADALAQWVKNVVPKSFFHKTDVLQTVQKYKEIMTWVQSHHFTEGAKDEFAKVADGWVVAYACANSFSVVTQEKLELERRNKVKIPNVCEQFGVPYCNSFTMLRNFADSFSWAARNS
jgi:hypothetical protein